MEAFRCRRCDNTLPFENSVCVSCGSRLGFSRAERAIESFSGCTWLTEQQGGQRLSCSLTRTRPNDEDAVGLADYPAAERAKRRVLVERDALGLEVIGKDTDPENDLAFDLLSSVEENVVIGHANGLITIDLAGRRSTV